MNAPENQVLVIFGASGDLTKRKLIPAVFNLFSRGFLPEQYAIVGIGRTSYTDTTYRNEVILENEHVRNGSKSALKKFAKLVHYQSMETASRDAYHLLTEKLDTVIKEKKTPRNLIFYLSTPPKLYGPITSCLASQNLNDESNGWKRLIVEKPFGYDLASAKALNRQLLDYFFEDQIFRIDHYLGKETVQNLIVARFGNSIFEPLWNRNYIHRIEITAAERVGVEKRGGYYEESGALRDMVQNHLLQLLSLVAMEPPTRIEADAIRNEKLKLFQSLRPFNVRDIRTNVIRGQYLASKIQREKIPGYRDEPNVDPNSRTETFVAMKFFIDNWRWADVPFYIRTGKRLPTRVSEVVIHFKPNHHRLFKESSLVNKQNMLVFRIQPNEGILLKFGLKIPGAGFDMETVNMDFNYDDLTEKYVPEAYERLILDCMHGDQTLYARGDSLEAAWAFVDPILAEWKRDQTTPIYGYPAGTWGPPNVDELIEEKGMMWRYPGEQLTDDDNFCEL